MSKSKPIDEKILKQATRAVKNTTTYTCPKSHVLSSRSVCKDVDLCTCRKIALSVIDSYVKSTHIPDPGIKKGM